MSELSNPSSPENNQLKIDNLLNKMVLDISVYSALGWTAGLAVGLFFSRKTPIRNMMAGIGGGYGYVNNRMSLKKYL